jgi:ankyrin repeat protein
MDLSTTRWVILVCVTFSLNYAANASQIHDAAAEGDAPQVKALLRQDPTLINAKDRYGATPLHWAAAEGHKDVVLILLVNKADVNARSNNGATPLKSAALRGRTEIVEILLAHGADVNAKDNEGETALQNAAFRGHEEIVQLLLSAKADINTRDNRGSTPLHEAAAAGNLTIVQLLVAGKADVNAKDLLGNTPLVYAARNNHPAVVGFLEKYSATVEQGRVNGPRNGQQTLHPASSIDTAGPASADEASAAENLKRAAAQIASAEQDLAEAKTSALGTFKTLRSSAIDADKESDKWKELADHEGDPGMKSITYGFRDAFRSHSNQLAQIEEELRELGRIGERLDLHVKMLSALHAGLEQVVQGKLAPEKQGSLLVSTKQGLSLLQQDVFLSAKMLKNSEKGLSAHTSSVLGYDKKVRQLLADVDDPQEQIKKWEKQLMETQLANNSSEAKELATVSSLGARIARVLTTIGTATKTLQLVTATR